MHPRREPGPPRTAHRPRAHRPARRRARAPLRRHPRTGRRRHRALVRRGRRRRVQHHAAGAAVRVRFVDHVVPILQRAGCSGPSTRATLREHYGLARPANPHTLARTEWPCDDPAAAPEPVRVPGGHHEAAWRYRESAPERVLDLSYYVELARAAEAATFDGLFLADGPSLADNIAYATRFRLEPFTLLSALAASTTHLGLIGTASTTYSEPYNLARQFAGLDHVSGGRAGWNIVTTGAPGAAQNFGLDEHPTHADRYERADGFLDVVTALWDSWEDDAVVGDQRTGHYADTDRIHRIDHVGPHFSVRGPLNTRAPAGPARLRPGGDVTRGAGVRIALGGRRVRRPPDARGGAGLLRRPARPGGGPRPGPRQRARPAGHQPVPRLDGGRGQGPPARARRADPARLLDRPPAPARRR